VPAIEGVLVLALYVANPRHQSGEARYARIGSVALIALVNAANLVSLGELVNALISGSTRAAGRALIFASVPI
jgi:hypothetical protein